MTYSSQSAGDGQPATVLEILAESRHSRSYSHLSTQSPAEYLTGSSNSTSFRTRPPPPPTPLPCRSWLISLRDRDLPVPSYLDQFSDSFPFHTSQVNSPVDGGCHEHQIWTNQIADEGERNSSCFVNAEELCLAQLVAVGGVDILAERDRGITFS